MKRFFASLLLFLAEGLEQKRMPVGGQAVIEGVLMKGPERWGLSVRKPDGEIENETWNHSSRTKRMPWKLPVVRGVVTMVEMMTVGFRALNKSAQIAVGEEERITPKEFLLSVLVAIGAVVGSGAADKQQVQLMVMHLLGLLQKPQIDASDALAIALCHAHHRQSLIPHGLATARRRGGRLRL